MQSTLPLAEIPSLQHSIEAVYRAFAQRRLSSPMWECPCCAGTSLQPWETRALREIDENDLSAIQDNMPFVIGSLADLAFFVPRALDLFASTSLSIGMAEFTHKFFGGAETFNDAEMQALETHLGLYWDHYASHPKSDLSISPTDLVVTTAAIVPSIEPFLKRWADSSIIERYIEDDYDGAKLDDAYWHPGNANYDLVLQFVTKNRG